MGGMVTVVFWMEGDPDPLLISNPATPETIVKSNLFLLKNRQYHPVAQVSADAQHISVTFSRETLPSKPAGEQTRILLIEPDA
jgi:hypothetical protein